jgi:hypothetical protein
MWRLHRFPHEVDETAQRAQTDTRIRSIAERGPGETIVAVFGILLLVAMAIGIASRLLF